MTAQNLCLLVLREGTTELFLAIFHLRDEVLGELTDDVVLVVARQEEPNCLQIPVEQFHVLTPKECCSRMCRCSAIP